MYRVPGKIVGSIIFASFVSENDHLLNMVQPTVELSSLFNEFPY